MTGRMSRRRLLAGTGVASAALVAAAGVGRSGAGAAPQDPGGSPVPFDGTHQAGITTPEQNQMVFATYDVTAGGVTELAALLTEWTRATAQLTAGKPLQGPGGPFAPPPDTGETVGLSASQLTLTFGFGPSLFDSRFGLAHRRPAALVDLPSFPGDDLQPARCGGDLCVQACANDARVAFHAVRDLTRLAFGTATIRSMESGFGRTAAAGPGQPTPRNLLGFHDGTANLDVGDEGAMNQFVWVGDDADQPWMTGGTYLVSRRIRIHLEEWDRSTLEDQEQTIGRVKTSGAPLGENDQSDPVDLYTVGADGQPAIPATAHIRVASPTSNGGQAILRRGYSFADGIDPASGELDAGLFFICFQKDPRRQFIPIQTQLSQIDALAQYVVHTGSGIFACPPGVTGDLAYGHGLL